MKYLGALPSLFAERKNEVYHFTREFPWMMKRPGRAGGNQNGIVFAPAPDPAKNGIVGVPEMPGG
jgi:hypothetical protein